MIVDAIHHKKPFGLEAIVIDPDGLGKGQPTVGFGFRMAERHAGIGHDALSRWVVEIEGVRHLKLPSGKALRVVEIVGSDNNTYSVVEASDWLDAAVDLLINPGKTGKALKEKLATFVKWFAVKGFYAESYVALKGVYSGKDSRATTNWLKARQSGIQARKDYTDLLQSCGCQSYDYGNWTNKIYQGLFGMSAAKMKEVWDLMEGSKQVARNYIPKEEGLQAVRYCEDTEPMVVRLFVDDLEEAHKTAIAVARKKYTAKLVSV